MEQNCSYDKCGGNYKNLCDFNDDPNTCVFGKKEDEIAKLKKCIAELEEYLQEVNEFQIFMQFDALWKELEKARIENKALQSRIDKAMEIINCEDFYMNRISRIKCALTTDQSPPPQPTREELLDIIERATDRANEICAEVYSISSDNWEILRKLQTILAEAKGKEQDNAKTKEG